jgi:hypothetical protein
MISLFLRRCLSARSCPELRPMDGAFKTYGMVGVPFPDPLPVRRLHSPSGTAGPLFEKGVKLSLKWMGAIALGQRVIFAPFSADTILIVDVSAWGYEQVVGGVNLCRENQFNLQPNHKGPWCSSTEKFAGLAAVGTQVFFAPYSADHVIEVDGSCANAALANREGIACLGGAAATASIATGHAKWNGAVAIGTKVYCAPHAARSVLVIDTAAFPAAAVGYASAAGLSTIGFPASSRVVPASLPASETAWSGIAAIDNRIYCAAHNTKSVLAVDTVTHDFAPIYFENHVNVGDLLVYTYYYAAFTPQVQLLSDEDKYTDIVAVGTSLVMIPSNARKVISLQTAQSKLMAVNLKSTATAAIKYFKGNKYMGGVLVGTKMYAAPDRACAILVFDVPSVTASFSLDPKSQNIEQNCGRKIRKWSEFITVGDKLYAAPHSATNILAVDTTANTIRGVTVPNTLTPGLSRWNGIARLPGTNVLLAAPYFATELLRIDASTYGAELVSGVPAVQAGAPVATGLGKWAGITAVGSGHTAMLYCAPYNADKVLTINMIYQVGSISTDAVATGSNKWHGIAAAGDVRAFAAPYRARSILMIDKAGGGKVSGVDISYQARGFASTDTLWKGALGVGTVVYFAPYDATVILAVDDAKLPAFSAVQTFETQVGYPLSYGYELYTYYNAAYEFYAGYTTDTNQDRWSGLVRYQDSYGERLFATPSNSEEVLALKITSGLFDGTTTTTTTIFADLFLSLAARDLDTTAFVPAAVTAKASPTGVGSLTLSEKKALMQFANDAALGFMETMEASLTVPKGLFKLGCVRDELAEILAEL